MSAFARATHSLLSWLGNRLRNTPLARSALLNRIQTALAFRLRSGDELDWEGFRVRVDRRDRVIAKKLLLYGEYERHEIDHLVSRLRPGDTVLDVGANIGLYTLHLARAVGPEGKVIAVEPDPDNLALLRHNLDVNRCGNTVVLPCAFGDVEGSSNLYQVDDNRGNLSLADVRGTGRSVTVAVRRAGEALDELGASPRVAKIDAQGAEPQVFATLRSRPEVILFEFAPPLIRSLGGDPASFLRALTDRGYRVDLIDHHTGALSPIAGGESVPAGNLAILARL